MAKRCYVFDVDGTLADYSHRLHHINGIDKEKDWDAFFEDCVADPPIDHMCDLAWALRHKANAEVVCVSGRSDQVREQTEHWLLVELSFVPKLYMRKAGDHRPDWIVKRELLAELCADGYEPIMVFDDRNIGVKMWREQGVPCMQVAEGDF